MVGIVERHISKTSTITYKIEFVHSRPTQNMLTHLRGRLTEGPRVKGLLLRRNEGTTGGIMQIKDKVLDGVGKHFVGHGCFVLLILLVVEGKGRRETYRDRRLEGAGGRQFQTLVQCSAFPQSLQNANTSLVYSYGTS